MMEARASQAGRDPVRRHGIETGEPAFPFHAGADVPVDPSLCWLVLVERGPVRLECQDRTYALLPGTLLLVPPGAPHRVLRASDAAVASVSFPVSLLDPLALDGAGEPVAEELGLTGPERARSAAPWVQRLPAAELRQASSLFSLVAAEARDRKPGYQAMVRLRLMEAVLLLYRARHGSSPTGDGAPLRFHLGDVQRFLQEKCADELSLSGVASRYGLNPSYFSRRFRQEAGVSLVAYINRLRIQKSCLLLKRTRIGILEIAYAVGYRNLSHFNRYFRRIMGVSPREYRAASQK